VLPPTETADAAGRTRLAALLQAKALDGRTALQIATEEKSAPAVAALQAQLARCVAAEDSSAEAKAVAESEKAKDEENVAAVDLPAPEATGGGAPRRRVRAQA